MIGSDNILGTETHIWLWNNSGVWEPVHDRILKQRVQECMEENSLEVTRGRVDAVTDVLKTEVYGSGHEWDKNTDIVNVSNGELNWDGQRWELTEHAREHYLTTQIPVAYDLNADCPRFKRFLEEIFAGDPDSKEKVKLILEMMGYTLMSHARFEHFILLIGSGSNGKSVILDTVAALVGTKNVAAVQPSKFSSAFQRAHLHLKLANLVTEIPEGGQIADAELKAITSGELMTVEHKNKDPFDFCPFSTCWFGTNHMPHTRDFSDALFRRAIIITFNRIFKKGVDADPKLKDTLKGELQGIMNMALRAYSEVIKRGFFTEPQSSLDAKEEWRKEVDQVVQFTEEKCVLEVSSEIESGALYRHYEQWCIEAGISRKLGRKNFSKRLVRMGCKLHKGTAGRRMIKGIRIGWEVN